MTPTDPPQGAAIREALIDSAYLQGKGGMLMNFLVLGGIVWLHKLLAGELIHPVWLGSMLLVTIVRSTAVVWITRNPSLHPLLLKERLFVVPLLLTSLLWAMLPLLMFSVVGSDERLALVVVFAGMAGGAATLLAPLAWSARTYLICMLAPTSIILMFEDPQGIVLGVLGLTYLAVILNAHRQARGVLIDAQQGVERNRQLSVAADLERGRAEQLNRELVSAQGALRKQNALLTLSVEERTEKMRLAEVAIENTAEGVIILGPDARILEVNPGFTQITGFSADAVIGQESAILRSTLQDSAFYERMWTQLRTEGRWEGELWSRTREGPPFLERRVANAVRDAEGAIAHYVTVFSDITEARRKDERIRHIAFHDALTGLPNRQLLDDRIQNGVAIAARKRETLALMFIDLDHFKSVNDGLGHNIGDLLLQQVAKRIRDRLRESDTLARLGGDEFVVLLNGTDDDQRYAVVAQGILEAIEAPAQILSHSIHIGASIGIAVYPEDGTSSDTLLKNADTAMYEAKAAGRGTFRHFQSVMSQRATYRLELESELRSAIDQDELSLHYQAKVSATTGEVCGYEALLRWSNPQRGMIPPGDFIPLAEDSGLIGRIGDWVISEACRQIASWHAAGFGWQRVSINVSARQILSDDVVARLSKALRRTGVPPTLIEIELTESVLMAQPDKAAEALGAIKALGVSVAIDDFGTGYSSLAYLRRMPIDVLKIDRSFVSEAQIDANGLAIIQTILTLGKTLNLTVVAEGVETTGQRDILRALGCDLLQGYLFAHPLPPEQLVAGWQAAEVATAVNLPA
jgi:diguanylate cyclase (GGDEF)-like protein/PAS domain S-box-containing protein